MSDIDSPTEDKGKTKRQKLIDELKYFSFIFFIVFAFRSSFFEPFKIPTGSMIPTLVIGDFILVNKMQYGFKIPFSEWLGDPIYLTAKKIPERGDVIVFKHPENTSKDYIKRVIALPGEKIYLRKNIVYIDEKPINGKEVPGKKFLEDMDDQFKKYKFKFFKFNKNKSDNYFIQLNPDEFHNQEFTTVIVPKGHLFVLGDNRDFSNDSRKWGVVPIENVKGKAKFVWFSMIFPFGKHRFKFRPWRIGHLIH